MCFAAVLALVLDPLLVLVMCLFLVVLFSGLLPVRLLHFVLYVAVLVGWCFLVPSVA